jgi:hypothetical protein
MTTEVLKVTPQVNISPSSLDLEKNKSTDLKWVKDPTSATFNFVAISGLPTSFSTPVVTSTDITTTYDGAPITGSVSYTITIGPVRGNGQGVIKNK